MILEFSRIFLIDITKCRKDFFKKIKEIYGRQNYLIFKKVHPSFTANLYRTANLGEQGYPASRAGNYVLSYVFDPEVQ